MSKQDPNDVLDTLRMNPSGCGTAKGIHFRANHQSPAYLIWYDNEVDNFKAVYTITGNDGTRWEKDYTGDPVKKGSGIYYGEDNEGRLTIRKREDVETIKKEIDNHNPELVNLSQLVVGQAILGE